MGKEKDKKPLFGGIFQKFFKPSAKAEAKKKKEHHLTVQRSIPYLEMGRDGICRVEEHLYSKTVRFYDINYQLAQNEDKNTIFESWCDFLNYFDELQKNYYTDYIQAQPGWVFVGIYADEGISGTSLEHRKGMQQLIEDCKAGKIDLVLTKSIARFARNIVDCLSVIELLKNLNPPVGVKFEADNIYTLDSNGRMILTILASVAEEESHSKSIIMNWSIDRRFSRGLFLTPALLGYDKDEEGNLVINPEEAQTVKVIYYLYLNGYSLTEIATLLMEYSRKTKLGRVEWNPGTLAGVLANERHCGDVLARKTFTPNFLTHKSKKNNNDRTQYRQKNHHEAIVSREVFNAANHLRASRNYSKKNRPLPVLSVVEDGILRGYVPFDKDWTGFSAEEYREASESVMKEPDATVAADVKKRLDLTGYEVVRAQYFSTMQNPAMTISNGRLRFNTACLKKFENVEYVELLLNSVERCIAIRPCNKNNPNAIRWGRLKEGRWCASTLGCHGLAKTLFDIMEWDEDLRYRFRGQFLEQGDNKMMLFAFDEPEMIKVEEIVLPPKENTEEDEGETVKKKIYIFPPEWAGTFGQPITSIAQVGILRQEHYAGNWDVFRPATEIEEMNIFTAESLNELLREAEKIMEGWTDYVFDLLVPEIFHEGQRKKNAVDSQNNAASTKPVNSRKGFYLDDIVGTFGVPVEEHRKESEVKQMDGYVSMGILTGKIAPEAGKD